LNGVALRIAVFVALVLVLGLAEWRWPRNRARPGRRRRWPVNFGFGALNVLTVRLLLPWLAVDAALWAQANQLGVLNAMRTPAWASITISLLALDLVIYAQHRLMHRIGWLWRVHRMHHTDLALDVSSGVRFHPLEIVFSMLVKIAAVIALGAPAAAVLGFEILLSSFALFTHTNLYLPGRLDSWLRWVIVTPDMHRIHHSVLRDEHDRNFGFHVSWWDRIFRSYRQSPSQPQQTMTLGLGAFRDAREQGFPALLRQPFVGESQ